MPDISVRKNIKMGIWADVADINVRYRPKWPVLSGKSRFGGHFCPLESQNGDFAGMTDIYVRYIPLPN